MPHLYTSSSERSGDVQRLAPVRALTRRRRYPLQFHERPLERSRATNRSVSALDEGEQFPVYLLGKRGAHAVRSAGNHFQHCLLQQLGRLLG
jgi:hypothetical protein